MKTTDTFIVYSDIKKVERLDDITWLRGSFSKISKELAKGNKLAGISMETGKIGFAFSDKPDIEQETISVPTPPVEPPKAPEGKLSRDGEIIEDGGRTWIIREIKVLKGADEMIPSLAMKANTSVDEIQRAVFVSGMNSLLRDIIKETDNDNSSKKNFFDKLF